MHDNVQQLRPLVPPTTEQELRNTLKSTVFSPEELAVATLLDLLNGELTVEELRQELTS